MVINQQKLEKLKLNLYGLHALLTEKQTEESILDGANQFKICFEGAIENLYDFLQNEFNLKNKSHSFVIESAFENKLFNNDMTVNLRNMSDDYGNLKSKKGRELVYPKIQTLYAGFLQMIYDMLLRMGQDAKEES